MHVFLSVTIALYLLPYCGKKPGHEPILTTAHILILVKVWALS